MTDVYSTSLLQVSGLLSPVDFLVPAGFRCVVVDVEHYWNGPSVVNQTFFRGDNGQTWFFIENTVTSGQRWGTFTGRVVIDTSFQVEATNDPVDVTVSGYLLSLP